MPEICIGKGSYQDGPEGALHCRVDSQKDHRAAQPTYENKICNVI